MLVALHSAPIGLLKSRPPYRVEELLNLVHTAKRLGFSCLQIGPTSGLTHIGGNRLRVTLDKCGMKRNVHVGGLYDADRFAESIDECQRVRNDLHKGIELSIKISSPLVSLHPPFSISKKPQDKTLLSRIKTRFAELLREEVNYAQSNRIKIALESFCYSPFIFAGLEDFIQFVSKLRSSDLGILLEVGHLFQAGFNLDEAIRAFGDRILDVHIHDATLNKDYKNATHLPLGKGAIKFSEVIASLRKVNYDGWLTLEINGDEGEIVESRKLLEKLIATN